MANELEQRARELLAAEYERRGYRHQAAGVRAGEYPAYDEQKDITCKAIVAALQQAQQPINGDVESSKAAAVPSVDGGPGNYVAPASPPSQQPGAQAVESSFLGWVRRAAIEKLRTDDEVTGVMVHAEEQTDSVKVYTAPPPLPEGVSEALSDVDFTEDEANEVMDHVLEHGPRLIPTEAYQQMRHVLIEASRLAAKGGV